MTLGDLVKKFCQEHDMSLQQFADRAKLSKAYVSMLVRGKNPSTGKPVSPTLETYNNIAFAMGMSLQEIVQITQQDVPTNFHVIAPKGPDRYRGLADAIVGRLIEAEENELLGPKLSDDENRLLAAYRSADPVYRGIALELLEGHRAE